MSAALGRRFEVFADEVMEPTRRYLHRRTDADTAEDVLSETLLACWRRFDEVPAESIAWAIGVARLQLRNAQRSARRQERLAQRIRVVDPPRATVSGPDADDADDAVRVAIASLPAKEQEVVRLWAWEELTVSEIATALDVSPNAVSIRLHRAKRRLRTQLERSAPADGHAVGEGGRQR